MLPSSPSIRLGLANRIPVPEDRLFLAGPEFCFELYEKPPFLASCHWMALVTAILLFSLVTTSRVFVADVFNIGCPPDAKFSLAVGATSVLAVEIKYTVVASRSPFISAIIDNSNIQKPIL